MFLWDNMSTECAAVQVLDSLPGERLMCELYRWAWQHFGCELDLKTLTKKKKTHKHCTARILSSNFPGHFSLFPDFQYLVTHYF